METRFISLKGKLCAVNGEPSMKVVIVEQSHRRHEFNPQSKIEGSEGSSSWEASNGVRLLSYFNPEFVTTKDGIKFFLRGSSYSEDLVEVYMTPREYEMVIEAVDEYNMEYGTKTEVKKTTRVQVLLKNALEDCREQLINLREEQEITDEKIDELEKEAAKIRMALASYEGKT